MKYLVLALVLVMLLLVMACGGGSSSSSWTITIDKIGVLDDKEPFISEPGDVYLYVSISSDKGQPVTVRIPSSGAIELEDNQVRNVNRQVWSGAASGELKMVAIAFESDPELHGLLRSTIVEALSAYLGGGLAGMAGSYLIQQALSGGDVSELAESSEDDLVGAIERKCNPGTYTDVRGSNLRLWYTVK